VKQFFILDQVAAQETTAFTHMGNVASEWRAELLGSERTDNEDVLEYVQVHLSHSSSLHIVIVVRSKWLVMEKHGTKFGILNERLMNVMKLSVEPADHLGSDRLI
jgi:hypothetical protein